MCVWRASAGVTGKGLANGVSHELFSVSDDLTICKVEFLYTFMQAETIAILRSVWFNESC
jgi:hypothetical protein